MIIRYVRNLFTIVVNLLLFSSAQAAVITSVQNGNWTSKTTWDCNCKPGNNDDIIIASGTKVTVDGILVTRRSAGLTIQAGAELTHGLLVLLEVRGNYINDGIHKGTGQLVFRGNNSSIAGTGTVALTLGTQVDKTLSFVAGCDLTFTNGPVNIKNGRIITNNGTITIQSDLVGGDNTLQWINAAGSVLNVYQAVLVNGLLDASAVGNTVHYAGGSQVIKQPLNDQYFNLSVSGSGNKLMPSFVTTILGDLSITDCDFDRQGLDMYLGGNWINSGGTHFATAGTVYMTGSVIQTITNPNTENFFNLDIAGTGTLLDADIHVFGDLTINTSLDAGVNSKTITLEGQWLNYGMFNQQAGLVNMAGSLPQAITGINTFYDLSISNSSGVSLADPQNLIGTLWLTSGTFDLSGNAFTLISNSAGTARIAAITGGSISGDITMQRYIPAGISSWRFLAVPVTGRTYADWMDDLVMTGFAGSHYPNYGWTSVYTYSEPFPGIKDSGYVPASNITQSVVPGRGYWVYMGPGAINLDVTGPAVTGNFNFPPLTYTNTSGGFFNDGWNQIGNPYPSSIDWDATTGWTKTNLDNAIYIWSSQAQQYTAYVAGIGVNGGSRYVPSSQSFWIHGNAATPSLSCTEAVKASNDEIFRNTANDYLSIEVSSTINQWQDQTVVRFHPQATDSLDGALDALKFFTDNPGAPSLFSRSGNSDYSVNSVKWIDSTRYIPLYFNGLNANYTLHFDLDSLERQDACLTLQDMQTGVITDISSASSLTFTHSSGFTGPRFMLGIHPSPKVTITTPACPVDSNSVLLIESTNNGFSYHLTDSSGFQQTSVASTGTDTIHLSQTGPYYFHSTHGAGCNVQSTQLDIHAPDSLKINFETHSWNCDDSTGMLALTVTGGTAPYQVINWPSGVMTTPVTAGDILSISILDANGCQVEDTLSIDFNNFTTADFSYQSNGLEIQFSSQSVNAISWFWDFGDNTVSFDENPVHQYPEGGGYLVTLIAGTDSCSSQYSEWITVQPTSIEGQNMNDSNVWYSNGYLYFSDGFSQEVRITDLNGRVILRGRGAGEKFDVSIIPPGYYLYKMGEKRGSFVK